LIRELEVRELVQGDDGPGGAEKHPNLIQSDRPQPAFELGLGA
jgi:hypothetical protein